MVTSFDTPSALIGLVGGFLATFVAGKKLVDLVIDSYTAKLMEKFDQRYASREALHDLKERVKTLEGGE